MRKAFSQPGYNHGLYNAIRKYGPDSFVIEVLSPAQDKKHAQKLERKYIAEADKRMLYNVSPGGEADGETGGKVFWGAMNADPEARAAYIGKLSAIKRGADWSDYTTMSAQVAAWRTDNPKEAYRLARRGTRIANRNNPKKPEDTRTLKERLMWKHKRGEMVRRNTTAFWQSATKEQKAQIAEKIRATSKAQWETVTDPKARAAYTAKARAAIDRDKQGKAASNGVKQWWADLKADPARYAAYMETRTRSLRNTLKEKACAPTT